MKKKVLAGILAATMAFSMAACGSTGSSSDSGSSAASGSTAKTEEKGEPYTVTMVLQGSQQQDEERIEEKINEILEPELNAKLDIVVLPWASASQQLQLMLSGDEKIDLLYTSATTAVQYMHSGQIMDMSELIDKYGTNLKDIYGEDIAKTNQIDGFVYGVPNQIERGSIPAIFMRKDLVEKYNINTDEIKEPKDMEKVFETVQAGEPDMTMLFSSNNSDTPLSRLSRADGLGDANTGALMDQTNSTTVENYFASDCTRRLQLCCMTGIRKATSARMPEQTQKTGEPYAKQEISSPCSLLIIQVPRLSSRAPQDMSLKSYRSMISRSSTHPLTAELFIL